MVGDIYMSRSDDIEELSEYLAIDMDMSYDELQHFDLPKFKLPKIDLPKFELPKIDLPFGKKDKKKTKSKEKDKKDKKKDKKKEGIGTKDKESGRYGREWKDHKWVDRKRDENGKWIYDYGDGFPDEKNLSGGVAVSIHDRDDLKDGDFKLLLDNEQNNKLSKVTGLLSDLGKLLISPDLNDKIASGKNFLGRLDEIGRTAVSELRKVGKKVDPESGLRMKDSNNKDTIMDDLDSVNPGFNNMDNGSQFNCPECTIAMDMRRRGYEVTAKEDVNGTNYATLESMYQGGTMKTIYSDRPEGESTIDVVYDVMTKEPEGSNGMMTMMWNPPGSGGHVVHYEIENGEPVIYDAQSRERIPAWQYADRSYEVSYMRTDNLEPNWDLVKKMVE